ncbi:hypothetical protein FDP22_11180 [Paroceanicella profunda]|uniref:Uncharacterized protein n=1 Tax=Paroceanicella profunda TaxID=2579971 RepID=A0A5B8FZR6_9RHOB|nr:hypothetical protein [Paroceanicella profunda]QDL92289.1 hypothetical protein FDP22_11180 [Paroceanicella profunda]
MSAHDSRRALLVFPGRDLRRAARPLGHGSLAAGLRQAIRRGLAEEAAGAVQVPAAWPGGRPVVLQLEPPLRAALEARAAAAGVSPEAAALALAARGVAPRAAGHPDAQNTK